MPSFTATLHHALTRREARRRVERLIHQLEHRYAGRFDSAESAWEGDDELLFRLVRDRTVITGRVAIGGRSLHVTVEVPWSLAPVATRLRQQFEQEGRRLLGG